MSGKNNEDQYAISAYTLSEDDPTPVVFAIVADGIGGHSAGEIASEIAVNTISAAVAEHAVAGDAVAGDAVAGDAVAGDAVAGDAVAGDAVAEHAVAEHAVAEYAIAEYAVAESDGSEPLVTLREGIGQASASIREQSEFEAGQQGMGSTCVCALVIGEQLYIASVGDSRIYLLREGKIQRLTTDHTWVQEAIEHGVISAEEAQDHPRRHVIHRYLGSSKPTEVDIRLRLNADESDPETEANQGMNLLPGDQVLLCSDGLTDLVSDEEILSISQGSPTHEEALEKLVDLANERGGHDNITIVSLLVPEEKEPEPEPEKPSKIALWLTILGVLVIIVINIVGYVLWKGGG